MCYCHTTWINLTNIMSNKVSQPPTIYILYNSIYKKFENRKIGSWVGYLMGSGEKQRESRDWRVGLSPGSWSFNSHMHTQVATQPDSGNPLLISRAFSVQLPPLWYSAPQTLATFVSQNPPLRPSGLGFPFLPWGLETAFRQDAGAIEGLTSFVCLFPWITVLHSLLRNV